MNRRGQATTGSGDRRVLKLRVAVALLLMVVAVSPLVQARHSGSMRAQPIDMIVLHSTGGPFCDPASGRPIWVLAGNLADNIRQIEAHPVLGIHYMIDRDGTRRASVPEDQLAHHVFTFSGRSIAIELINDGDGVDPFPDAQLSSLVLLLRDITSRRAISREGIVRHSDLDHGVLPCDRSQRRKVDPGAAFPFEMVLARVFDERTYPGDSRSGADPAVSDSQ